VVLSGAGFSVQSLPRSTGRPASLHFSNPPRSDLERHLAIQPTVASAVDLTHPACAERRDNGIRPEVSTRCEAQAGIIAEGFAVTPTVDCVSSGYHDNSSYSQARHVPVPIWRSVTKRRLEETIGDAGSSCPAAGDLVRRLPTAAPSMRRRGVPAPRECSRLGIFCLQKETYALTLECCVFAPSDKPCVLVLRCLTACPAAESRRRCSE
jgi:hypothetical protein